jgi:RecB family exonuclease
MGKDPSKLTLSPSKVDTFYGCRRLFKYRYISPPFVPEENRFFLIGNIAHKTLENLHKNQMDRPVYDWKKEMAQQFKSAIKTYDAYNKIKKGVITKSDLYDIKRMLSKYLKYLKVNDIPKVFQVEKLAKISFDGVIVWLKADRIDELGENAYKVVDYKSGSPATKKDELASVQIPSYGLWLRKLVPDADEIKGQYLYLRYIDSRRGIHTYDISNDMMDLAREKYLNVNQKLKNGCDFKQNFKYKYCRYCDFRRHCLEDENNELS